MQFPGNDPLGSPEQVSAGATAALRDGMRERRRREWLIPFARSLTRQTARKAPSPLGCGKIGRDRAGRSSVFQRKMRPRSGLLAPQPHLGGPASPPLPDPRFARPLGPRSGEPSCCAPWHRSPGYDLRRAPYDHPDFTSNALSEDLFRASFTLPIRLFEVIQLSSHSIGRVPETRRAVQRSS
jgi:hypothetical protein